MQIYSWKNIIIILKHLTLPNYKQIIAYRFINAEWYIVRNRKIDNFTSKNKYRGFSPDSAEDGVNIWVPLIFGPQQENILCFTEIIQNPFSHFEMRVLLQF